MRTIGPTLRIAEAVTGPRENDTHIGRIAQRLAEIRHMITLEDCIGMCGLTEEEYSLLPSMNICRKSPLRLSLSIFYLASMAANTFEI